MIPRFSLVEPLHALQPRSPAHICYRIVRRREDFGLHNATLQASASALVCIVTSKLGTYRRLDITTSVVLKQYLVVFWTHGVMH